MASTTARSDFEALWPKIAQDILNYANRYAIPEQALKWFEKVCFPFVLIACMQICLSLSIQRQEMSH
jgi:uncharacterized protein (DUF3820 family)